MFRLPLVIGVWSVERLVLCAWLCRKGVEEKFWPSSVLMLQRTSCPHMHTLAHMGAHTGSHAVAHTGIEKSVEEQS